LSQWPRIQQWQPFVPSFRAAWVQHGKQQPLVVQAHGPGHIQRVQLRCVHLGIELGLVQQLEEQALNDREIDAV